jgi:2-C-methyl-D-erythritol 4-phosphate cytidylyltransferase
VRRPAKALWVVIPGAGSGVRFGGGTPKQYLPLAGRTVIEWALRPFLARDDIAGIVVVVAPGDDRWDGLRPRSERVVTVRGGAQRAHSVLNGLEALEERAGPADWVLVHDAARPCLADEDLDTLLKTVDVDGPGGLLAVPVQDTLKRADEDDQVVETLDRHGVWRALTPQVFPYRALIDALRSALAAGVRVTDESSAIERSGAGPKLVLGRADNIKITVPEDLALAEFILSRAGVTRCA